MSRVLPPLDMHAHVDPSIAPRDLEALGAVVFVATRSADEYVQTSGRTDAVTVWGLGCHPALINAQAEYDENRFASLLATTPFVSEVGIDGTSGVDIEQQAMNLVSILALVAGSPRLLSVHSKRAARRTLEVIEQSGVNNTMLHWWLGSESDTRRAIDIGCLFSVNRSMDIGRLKSAGVPLCSILPETDHPGGNRRGASPRQPGWTIDVEQSVAAIYGTTPDAVRQQFWSTLARLVAEADVAELLPPVVQAMVNQARLS